MRDKVWCCFIVFFTVCVVLVNCLCTDGADKYLDDSIYLQGKTTQKEKDSNCWMSLKAKKLFRDMKNIDSKFAKARAEAQSFFNSFNFDKSILQSILKDRAIAYREVPKVRPNYAKVPSGINLGGLCMMRMPHSVLFFHRMKLRNDTYFRINSLHHDIENMVLKGNLSLNTLHLAGAYDRSMTDKDPSALIYTPSFGELQISMEEVEYTIQGRYRLIKERLVIELIVSTIDTKHISLTYAGSNETEPPMTLQKKHMEDFIMRVKTDLDKWIQDYFNDFFMKISLEGVPSISEVEKYDQQKATQLAVFTDDALTMMNNKLRNIGGNNIRLPNFKILASYGLTIEIYDGSLRGLDTMYRRSVATTVLERENLRYVDFIVGFSDLKVSYQYEVLFPVDISTMPPLSGVFIMSADELTAHLSLGLLNDLKTVELDIDFINRLGPGAITVEGAGNLYISNFKHILEHEIATIMSNSVTYGVGLLRTLPRCKPFIPGMLKGKSESEIINTETTPMDSSDDINSDSKSMESGKSKNALI